MLFLVISNPTPSKSSDVKEARKNFRAWISDLQTKDKVIAFYPRVGRGSVVIFDVFSNDELHELTTQWTDIVPARFDIYPLATPGAAEKLLQ